MPETDVVFYREDDGTVPVLEWLDGVPLKARLKCLEKVERLRELGHELRRPEADFLRDGVHELRVSLSHVQYRVLYAFSSVPAESEGSAESRTVRAGAARTLKAERARKPTGRRTIAVLAHAIIKEDRVPNVDIERAITRMNKFRANPEQYTYREE